MRFEDWVASLTDEVKKKAGQAIIKHNVEAIARSHNGKCLIHLNEGTENAIKGTKYHYAVPEYEDDMYNKGMDMVDYPLHNGRFKFNTRNWVK